MHFHDYFFLDHPDGLPRIALTDIPVKEIMFYRAVGMSDEDLLIKYPQLTKNTLNACTLLSAEEFYKSDSSPLDEALINLKEKSKWLNGFGVAMFLATIVFGLILFDDIKTTTNEQAEWLKSPSLDYDLLIYLVVRGLALSAVAGTLILFGARTAVACFDQSARFSKRRYGALFLKYLYGKYDPKSVHDKDNVEQIIKFFEAWNQNIESAFSGMKFGKTKTEPIELKASKDGVEMRTGDRR